ncbi:hypothetical protein F4778DRAFT_738535 [Xylariomycetidae sp. FL2044]|nr:hypothetical protein F4778DRAFT_738535 [Xylariomycetidae sp. FL2044]
MQKFHELLRSSMSGEPAAWITSSTHIHMSRNGKNQFPLVEAKRIAFAAVCFQRIIDQLLPMPPGSQGVREGGWRDSFMAKSNPVRGATGTMLGMWRTIESCPDYRTLCGIVCPRDGSDTFGREWKWNFRANGRQTIKYRQPPPSTDIGATSDWITFTLNFVQAAIVVDYSELNAAADERALLKALGLESRPMTLDHLRIFLSKVTADVAVIDRLITLRDEMDAWFANLDSISALALGPQAMASHNYYNQSASGGHNPTTSYNQGYSASGSGTSSGMNVATAQYGPVQYSQYGTQSTSDYSSQQQSQEDYGGEWDPNFTYYDQ